MNIITTNLLKTLKVAVVEKDVETAYKTAFEKLFPGDVSSPDRTDGILRNHILTSLLEFKFDLDLKNLLERSSVIVQSLFALKKMQDGGKPPVKVVFIASVNKCFCISTKNLIKYFSYDKIDWSVAPSEAAAKNPAFVAEIAEDENIQPFVYDVDENFDFLAVIEKMKSIFLGKPYLDDITTINFEEAFKQFEKNVMKDKLKKNFDNKKISEAADLFFTCLTSPNDAFEHPNKEDIVMVKGREIKINVLNYNAFFSHYRKKYKPSELEKLTAIKDRIIEEIVKRWTGAFYTPRLWVTEAHKMIASAFGDDWKEQYVVWDCAAGTANLTRGYKFKELYISTLDQSDIDTINDMNYNPEATIFQYDFLSEIDRNDILSGTGIDKVPDNLKQAFESGKKIVFFINPPFGTTASYGKKSRIGIAKNIVNTEMIKNKMGLSSSQLFAQFLYKILALKKLNPQISVASFSSPLFMTTSSFKKFRDKIQNSCQFLNGMLFQASHFVDVKTQWGVCFTVWEPKTEVNVENKKVLLLKDVNDNYEIETIGTKEMYAPNGNACSNWVRKEIKRIKTQDAPQLSSSITVKQKGCGKIVDKAIGYLSSNANNVNENTLFVVLFSSSSAFGSGFSVIPENFRKVAALFTARKSIYSTWINCKDEYLIPNTTHPDYEQWNNDAIIYSLFNSSSQQSSLRQVTYKNKLWDIKNEFFFMSNLEMMKLADNSNFNAMYQDTKTFKEDRYLYKQLQNITLSDDALQILTMAKQLVRKSISVRKEYHQSNPKYHLNAWDAGWAQLKPMFKEYFKEDYERFVEMYKKFEARMRLGVYKFGFLKGEER